MTESRDRSGVELTAVSKVFASGALGIHEVSLTIEPGEFVTFLGPSGSGKTTTLNTIAGFVHPTSGSVRIGGVDVTRLAPNKRSLGVVFQNYALFPHMSVGQNVSFGLHGRGMSKDERTRAVEETLSMVRLEGFGDRMPRELSGGQQQRVALARALVYRPPVLLMDEPLGALDKRLRDQMQIEIGRLHRELGITFLFVTHDQEEALALSDRIALFDGGRIVQVGTAEELYERPASLFAAEFLGESNLFRGVADGAGGVAWSGTTLRCAATDAFPKGADVAIVVRPETMRIVSDGVVRREEDSASAFVTDVAYFGSYRRVGLRFGTGMAGVVREGVDSDTSAVVGRETRVAWNAAKSAVVAWGDRA